MALCTLKTQHRFYTVHMAAKSDFPDYCCELLASVGPCQARRMFGGWGISLDGLTIAWVLDLGSGEKLWLKADADTRHRFEAAGCARFTYDIHKDGATLSRSVNYYSAPEDAMDSAHAMAPWARLALDSALKARSLAGAKRSPAKRRTTKPRAQG